MSVKMARIQNTEHQRLERRWSNRNFHLLLMGTENGIVTVEDSWVISYKMEHPLTI